MLLLTIIVSVVIGCFSGKLYKDKQATDSKISEINKEIIKYELQTHEYFSDAPKVKKYFIDSENELNKFYSIYSDELAINKEYLKNNSIFIQVEQVSSGSIQMKLSSVSFDNNTVNFNVDKNSPEMGTMDMAFWYLVAIIPNNKLNNLNLKNWSKPSEVLISSEKTIIYIKKIGSSICKHAKSLLEEIISKEDINENKNCNFFTILNLDIEKEIYNTNTIENIIIFLKKLISLIIKKDSVAVFTKLHYLFFFGAIKIQQLTNYNALFLKTLYIKIYINTMKI